MIMTMIIMMVIMIMITRKIMAVMMMIMMTILLMIKVMKITTTSLIVENKLKRGGCLQRKRFEFCEKHDAR